MRQVRFHPEAEIEMLGTAAYYEAQERGLGARFLVAIQEAVHRVRIKPLLYQLVDDDTRRCIARTFPFGVVYRDTTNAITVVAIMHLHREPGCWQGRPFPPGPIS